MYILLHNINNKKSTYGRFRKDNRVAMLSALAFQELYQELRIDRRILTILKERL